VDVDVVVTDSDNKKAWLFSPDNPDIDKELAELEQARGEERERLSRRFLERFQALVQIQSNWVFDKGFFDEYPCHSQVLRCGEVFREEFEAGNDPTMGVALKSPRGRTRTPAERNERIKQAVQTRLDAGDSLAAASRWVAERMVKGEIEGLSPQGLASRTIENIFRDCGLVACSD
jgi:hypothetical protein